MAMMNFIRKRLKFLMWVVAIGFVGGLFFIGGRRVGPSWLAAIMPARLLVTMPGCARSAGILMKVGNYNVGIEEFKRMRENNIEIAHLRYKDNFEAYAGNLDFDKLTAESVTRYALVLQEAGKQHVYVSKQEVDEGIKIFPYIIPEEAEARVRLYPFYAMSRTRDGRFNLDYYNRLLENEGKITPDEFTKEVRDGLRIARFKGMLTESAMVTDLEIQQEYRKQNEKAKIKYIEFPYRDFSSKVEVSNAELTDFYQKNILNYRIGDRVNISFVEIKPKDFESKVRISDAEIAGYYRSHQEEFYEQEKVKARHILVQVDSAASKEEKEKAKAYAEQILKEAKKPGADFAALEKKYAKEPFKVKYEDLGFFAKGSMEKPFEDAAFALTPGSISNVVETKYGYHVIKVEEKKPAGTRPLEEAGGEIMSKLMTEQAAVLAKQKAEDIQYTVMSAESLQAAVDANPDLNLRIQETGFFSKTDQIPKIGSSYTYRNIVEEAFKLKVGEISDLVEVKTGDWVLGYYVFKLIGKKPAVLPKLDEVKDSVTRDLKDEKARKLAVSEAQRIMAARSPADDLDGIAKRNDLKAIEPQPFSLASNGYIRSETSSIDSKAVMLKAFVMNVGEIAGPLEGRNGVYIIQLVERDKFDERKFAQDKEGVSKIRDQILRQKQQMMYETWYQKVRANSIIRSFMPSLVAS